MGQITNLAWLNFGEKKILGEGGSLTFPGRLIYGSRIEFYSKVEKINNAAMNELQVYFSRCKSTWKLFLCNFFLLFVRSSINCHFCFLDTNVLASNILSFSLLPSFFPLSYISIREDRQAATNLY